MGELRQCMLVNRVKSGAQSMPARDVFKMATLGGAWALGKAGRIGSLEPGKEADFIVVDPAAVDPAPERGAEPAEQVLSRLLYRASAGLVRETHVRGRLCHSLPG